MNHKLEGVPKKDSPSDISPVVNDILFPVRLLTINIPGELSTILKDELVIVFVSIEADLKIIKFPLITD